jgi:hypothetical protein
MTDPLREEACAGTGVGGPASTVSTDSYPTRVMTMTETTPFLLKTHLKQFKLPTMLTKHEKLACEVAGRDEPYDEYLLRLTELEVAPRSANVIAARIPSPDSP